MTKLRAIVLTMLLGGLAIPVTLPTTTTAQDIRCTVDSCRILTYGYAESHISMQDAINQACATAANNCFSLGGWPAPCAVIATGSGWTTVWAQAKRCCWVCS